MTEYKINNSTYRLNTFDKIRNEEDAYLIGYLLGDGGFCASTHKRKSRLFVSSTERYIIDFFKENYCPDTAITSKIPVNKTRNIVSSRESHVLMFSSKFDFTKFGVQCLKKDRTFHNVPKELFGDFLRGLFDADGSFSWGRRKDRDRLWCGFKITHQNKKALEKVQNVLLNVYNISSGIDKKKDEDCYVLHNSRRDDAIKFYSIMYPREICVICNKLKKESYESFLEEYRSF
jgi:hypothetical protein